MSSKYADAGASIADNDTSLEINTETINFPNLQTYLKPESLIYGGSQHHRTNTCDTSWTKSPSIGPQNDSQHTSSSVNATTNNMIQHQKKYKPSNGIYHNFNEDKHHLDTSYMALMDGISPSPLPPNHSNSCQSYQQNHNTILEAAFVPSSQKYGNSLYAAGAPTTTATMPLQFAEEQNTLKRPYDTYLRSIATSGITSSLHHQSFVGAKVDPITPFDCNSSGPSWASSTKESNPTAKGCLKPTSQEPDCGTNTSAVTNPIEHAAPKNRLLMSVVCDKDYLSEYQCLIREQIEIFEATVEEVESRDRGRNSAIVMGQVGIRCKHCAMLPARSRPRGHSYYTSTLNGLYQAAQKMTTDHIFKHCRLIPESIKTSLHILKQDRKRASDGKRYWAEGARSLGIRETNRSGLRLVTVTTQPKEGTPTNTKDD